MFAIDLNHPDIKAIRKHIKEASFKKGDMVLSPDKETTYLYSIRKGFVKLYTVNSREEQAIILIYGPDDIFPLSWIIGRQRQPFYFQAISDCEIALLPQDVFLKQMQDSSDVTFAVMHKIIEQFALFTSRVNNLEYKYARERLAYRLLLLSARFGETKGRDSVLPHISQTDLASMINVSREGVSREMSRFERVGLVEYSKIRIVIKNPDGLKKELGGDDQMLFKNRELA